MSDIYTWKPRLLKYRSRTRMLVTDTDGATITFDCGGAGTLETGVVASENSDELVGADRHTVVLGGNRTLALSNAVKDQKVELLLQQDATGSRTVTWFSGILWAGGSAPTLTSTANKRDLFAIEVLNPVTPVYLGYVLGQNF